MSSCYYGVAMSQKKTYPTGYFVRTTQGKLLRRCLAPWPRRARSMLDINCGDGRFLHLLWESGFDVLATSKPEERCSTVTDAISFTIEGADDTHLPFDEDYFDWSILHLQKPWPQATASIREAMRIASKGIALTFWNSFSLPFVMKSGRSYTMPRHNWWRIWHFLQSLHAGPIYGESTFFLRSIYP